MHNKMESHDPKVKLDIDVDEQTPVKWIKREADVDEQTPVSWIKREADVDEQMPPSWMKREVVLVEENETPQPWIRANPTGQCILLC